MGDPRYFDNVIAAVPMAVGSCTLLADTVIDTVPLTLLGAV